MIEHLSSRLLYSHQIVVPPRGHIVSKSIAWEFFTFPEMDGLPPKTQLAFGAFR